MQLYNYYDLGFIKLNTVKLTGNDFQTAIRKQNSLLVIKGKQWNSK